MSTDARFAPGEWYAVVAEAVTIVLPTSRRDRVASLWDLADSGAGADAVLDALLAGGLSDLEHFALLAHDEEHTRVIVRGAPTAAISSAAGDETVSAAPGTTWSERLVAGACGVRVSLAGDGVADRPLSSGIARVSVVEVGARAAPAGETPQAPAREDEDDWSDRDGQTRAGAPFADFERPAVIGQEIAPDVVAHAVASLVFSTGDVAAVDRTVLVGRAPETRRFASHEEPHVVTVPSPQQEISSTHLEIRPGAGADHGSAIATDLGSTNGTVLAQPGLEPEELTPGIAVSLVPGAVLDLGDGVTIQVTNP